MSVEVPIVSGRNCLPRSFAVSAERNGEISGPSGEDHALSGPGPCRHRVSSRRQINDRHIAVRQVEDRSLVSPVEPFAGRRIKLLLAIATTPRSPPPKQNRTGANQQ